MRTVIVVSLLVAVSAAPLVADTEVTQSGGRLSIRAEKAPVSEILERIGERTGMRIVYDGDPPALVVTRTLSDKTPVAAVVGMLEGLALKYAMVLDDTGTQVRVLLISTAPPPPRVAEVAPPSLPEALPEAIPMPPDVGEAPSATMPMAPMVRTADARVSIPAPPSPSYVGPFTPQGPGPIILPAPGANTETASVAAAAPPTVVAPGHQPLSLPSAALPPWMKASYQGN